jgi:hypothetical protein
MMLGLFGDMQIQYCQRHFADLAVVVVALVNFVVLLRQREKIQDWRHITATDDTLDVLVGTRLAPV